MIHRILAVSKNTPTSKSVTTSPAVSRWLRKVTVSWMPPNTEVQNFKSAHLCRLGFQMSTLFARVYQQDWSKISGTCQATLLQSKVIYISGADSLQFHLDAQFWLPRSVAFSLIEHICHGNKCYCEDEIFSHVISILKPTDAEATEIGKNKVNYSLHVRPYRKRVHVQDGKLPSFILTKVRKSNSINCKPICLLLNQQMLHRY